MVQGPRSLPLILSVVLFLVALFLPAADMEGVKGGFEAFIIGYFCVGIVFLPSHLLCVSGWIRHAHRDQGRAAMYGIGALYGPVLFLWAGAREFRTLWFPSGWVWLSAVLVLILPSQLNAISASDSGGPSPRGFRPDLPGGA